MPITLSYHGLLAVGFFTGGILLISDALRSSNKKSYFFGSMLIAFSLLILFIPPTYNDILVFPNSIVYWIILIFNGLILTISLLREIILWTKKLSKKL